MRFYRVLFIVSLSFSPLFVSAKETPIPEERKYISTLQEKQNRQFPREFLELNFPNGLKAFIIEDRAAQFAVVSMNVAAGFLMDPPKYRGMAHYLEHMLFLGTEKYPNGHEYLEFIEQNGGYRNAYTSIDHTNYQFRVNPSVLEEGLDRFAHFFIDPTFNEDLIPNELKNIESEYSKNLNNNDFRTFHLFNILANPAHPLSRVFQGNLQTLGNVAKADLMEFFKKNYTAEKLRLVIISPLPIKAVGEWVRAKFAGIPSASPDVVASTSQAPAQDPLSVPEFEEKALPRLIDITPVGDEKSVSLFFQVPSSRYFRYSSPHAILSALMQRTDEGSLSWILESKGWITTSSAELDSRSEMDVFKFQFRLTTEGLAHWKEVCFEFFKYVAFLKQEGLSSAFFKENQIISEINFTSKTPKNGLATAAHYAFLLQELPGREIEAISNLLLRFDPVTYLEILSHLSPEKVQIILSGRPIVHPKQENFYNIDYLVSPLNEEDIRAWSGAGPNSEMRPLRPNPFVPESDALVGTHQNGFSVVREDAKSQILIQTDHTFQMPVGNISLEIRTPREQTPEKAALDLMYWLVLKQSDLRWMNGAVAAGYFASGSQNSRGYILDFSGYTDKLSIFAKQYIQQMLNIQVSELEFESQKAGLIGQLKDQRFGSAHEWAVSKLELLRNSTEFSGEALIPYLEGMTLDRIKQYAREILPTAYVRCFAFGNVTPELAAEIVDFLFVTTGAQPLEAELRPLAETFKFPKGHSYAYQSDLAGANHAWAVSYQFGRTTPQLEAALNIGEGILSSEFFNDMRTTHTLGYIVEMSSYQGILASGLRFVIQSTRSLKDVSQIAEEWIAHSIEKIASMSPESFERVKSALIEAMDQPLSSYEQKHAHSSLAIFGYNGDMQWKQKRLEALAAITQEQVVQRFKSALSPEKQRKLIVYAIGVDGVPAGVDEIGAGATQILNLDAFRSVLPRYREEPSHIQSSSH